MKHILIIEDEFIIASSLEIFLTQQGYKVTSGIAKGITAVQEVEQNQYDLILMDIKLQGRLDGIDAMRKIRAFSSIPVIYIADDTHKATREKAEKTKPVAFVSKPFDYEELIEAIEQSWSDNSDKKEGKTRNPPPLLLP